MKGCLVMVEVAVGFRRLMQNVYGLPPASSSLGGTDGGARREEGGKIGPLFLLPIVDGPLALIGVPLGVGGAGSGILRIGVGGRRVTAPTADIRPGATTGCRRFGELDRARRHELG
jgi:hypothetical protein